MKGILCCAKKPFKIYVCINYLGVYHESCIERLSNLKLLRGYKVECCEKEEMQIKPCVFYLIENQTLKNIIQMEFEGECRKLLEKNCRFKDELENLQEELNLKDMQLENVKVKMRQLEDEYIQNETQLEDEVAKKEQSIRDLKLKL
ncbi:hypothetical protein HHI36_006722 [Cryptolaemus montrouzieri]|uniref:Uncharacterized protein n=1 Tax=Cryptolaemus montrouzieri TaxID=559131 RepID=A0ABD2NYP6_9CUCU